MAFCVLYPTSVWEQITRFMKFWRAAGSLQHPTAETHECYKAVTDALKSHIMSSLCYPEDLADWEARLKRLSSDKSKEAWQKEKPVEPTSRTLKMRVIGKEILDKFPMMSTRKHMYKNLLQVTTLLSSPAL